MADLIPLPDTASTLSIFSRPGEDIRLINSNSDSIFTFGDFRLYTSNPLDSLTSDTKSLKFDDFSTLDSLKVADFSPPQPYSVAPNELNLKASDAHSYAYFGSLYTETANAINNIIDTFPYAILAYDGGSGTTIYDYSQTYNNITGEKTATFKVPYSALTNQGGVVVNSATTIDTIGLSTDFDQFAIQMSAMTSSANTGVFVVSGYTFSAATPAYLQFTIGNYLEYVTGSTSTNPLYIRPTKERLAQFNLSLSELEYNMLYGFKFNVLNIEDDITEEEQSFEWPKTIDGFNPDLSGTLFDEFQDDILKAAADTDDTKTNILVKTVIPENFIELDSERQVYASLIQTYAHQFDEIKRYIDGIAYAHTITYSKEENVPDKFLKKLSNLLGWKLSDKFNELDLFEYIAGDADGDGNSYSHFNLEIWRRILINLNWLYKKKGTRDAIQFIFKLLGAPDCLLRLDEFTYAIQQTISSGTSVNINKINENGYVNYNASSYIFQEGGKGRGTGDKYINQWTPEFDPLSQVDNIKLTIADDTFYGSENILNTKEICMGLDPAQAIECDVFQFYQQSGTCWMWGSSSPPFSALTVPFEYTLENCDDVQPDGISGMTLVQYLDYVYTNLVDPRGRKVLGYTNTSFFYPQLRNAYLSYYYWTEPQSHRLTFHKLQPFLDLIEGNFNTYSMQLIPATTILECRGTIIRNTVFNRQKFVYKPGLNDGSEFRTQLKDYSTSLKPTQLSTAVNNQIRLDLNVATLDPTIVQTIKATMSTTSYAVNVNVNLITAGTGSYEVTGVINDGGVILVPQP